MNNMEQYSLDFILPTKQVCHGQGCRYIGDGHPTFNRNPDNGYINPYYWVDEFIPYYMEIMGVDRPWLNQILDSSRLSQPSSAQAVDGLSHVDSLRSFSQEKSKLRFTAERKESWQQKGLLATYDS